MFNSTSKTQPYRYVASLWRIFFFFYGESALPLLPPPHPITRRHFTLPTKQESLESLGILEPFYNPFLASSEFTLPAVVMIQTCGVFVEQVVFLTVNHHGPLPLKELHSTDETWVWRDPGGSWVCLRPASDYEWLLEPDYDLFLITNELALPEAVIQTCMWQHCGAGRFSYGELPRTPPLEGTSLHRRNLSVERPWGILSLFTTCFRLRVNWPCREDETQTCMRRLCGAGPVEKVVIFTMNHRGTLTPRELNRWNMILKRPWWEGES